tara:strand:- start:397 stop:534 length:138 start_codon:yes stop_codon:yes gene_type:complete
MRSAEVVEAFPSIELALPVLNTPIVAGARLQLSDGTFVFLKLDTQ